MALYRKFTDLAELEREYSPSSCIGGDISAYIKDYSDRSAAVKAARPFQTHHYGDHAAEALDYFKARPGANPVHVFIHGGYWQELGKDFFAFPAADFAPAGIDYVAINYGLAPAATMDQMVDRCRRALAWLYANAEHLGFDPAEVTLSGHSAGAHLAAMCLLGPGRVPDKAVLISGVFDLTPIRLTYVNAPLKLDAAAVQRNSPLFLLQAGARLPARTIITYGDNETAEFKRQSDDVAALSGVRALCIKDRNHFDVVCDLGVATTPLGAAVLGL